MQTFVATRPVTPNPFQIVFELFSENSETGLYTLMGLIGVLAFIAILWQVIQLLIHASEEKEVTRRKSYIIKILIATAIAISILGLIQMTNVIRYKSGTGGGVTKPNISRNITESNAY